jgi:hypothetical protein
MAVTGLIMATFIITKEQYRKNYSYALGKLLGQKARGSGDPANEFSILTTPNDDGTYTVETPDLAGRATRAAVQALFDDPNPEQFSRGETVREAAQARVDDGTATLADIREVLKT